MVDQLPDCIVQCFTHKSADSSVSLDLENKETQHVLGVKWNYADDELQIHINMRSKPHSQRYFVGSELCV